MGSMKKKNSYDVRSTLFSLEVLPKFYFMLASCFIPLVIMYDVYFNGLAKISDQKPTNYDFLGPSKHAFLNFFKSLEVLPLLTNVCFTMTGFIGILIMISTYFSLKNRYKLCFINEENPENNSSSSLIQIVLAVFLGCISFGIDICIGLHSLIPGFNEANLSLHKETGILLLEYMIATKLIFLVFSVIILMCVDNSYKNKISLESEKILINKWKNISLISIIYIMLFFSIYVFCKAISLGLIFKDKPAKITNTNKQIQDLEVVNKSLFKVSSYILTFFPYVFHILICVLIYGFSFLLESCRLCIYQLRADNPLTSNEKFQF